MNQNKNAILELLGKNWEQLLMVFLRCVSSTRYLEASKPETDGTGSSTNTASESF